MKIEWAPLKVPFNRRLETLAAAGWMGLVLFGEMMLMCTYIYFIFKGGLIIKTLCLIYGIFVYNDRDAASNGGRGQGSEWFRNLIWWKYYQKYVNATLHKTAELDPSKNYIFATFPHGVLCTGAFLSFCTNSTNFKQLFPGLRSKLVTLKFHFFVPLFRELVLSWGLASVDADSIVHMLKAPTDKDDPVNADGYTSNAVVIVVGGAQESLNCRPNNYTIVLKKRKGFCKIALKTGAHIVPVFSFGEVDLFDQPPNPPGSCLRRFQEYFKGVTGIAPACFIGRGFFQYSFGLIPRRKPINTVVGAPIIVEKIIEPTDEDILSLHNEFSKALVDLFETHKPKYIEDYEKIKLVIE